MAPVGVVVYRRLENSNFEVAVNTKRGWYLIDQDGAYPFVEPADKRTWSTISFGDAFK